MTWILRSEWFKAIVYSLTTELLEDKKGVELWGVDTSPLYLLFQTLLPLFWTLTCMIWMELTRNDTVYSRIAMILFYVQKIKVLGMTWNSTEHLRKNNKKPLPKMKTRGPTPFSRGWGARPLPRGPPGDLPTPNPTLYICFQEEKNRGEEIIAFYNTEPPPSPKTSQEGWSGVRSGLRRRGIRRCHHHQPSSIINFMMLTAVRE